MAMALHTFVPSQSALGFIYACNRVYIPATRQIGQSSLLLKVFQRQLVVQQAHKRWQIFAKKGDEAELKRQHDIEIIEQALPDFRELDKDSLQSILDLELESSFNLDTARHYEIMFLIHEDNVSEVPDVIQKVKDFIKENKGKIWRLNDWGMRRLAYKIKKARKANYILMNIELSCQAINQLNSLFQNDERVIRHMIITEKKAITKDSVPPIEYAATQGDEEKEDEDVLEEEEDDEDEDDEVEDEENSGVNMSLKQATLIER